MPDLMQTFFRVNRRDGAKLRARIFAAGGKLLMVVITLGASIITFIEFGTSWTVLLLALSTCGLVASLLANALFLHESLARKNGAKNIIFLTPSSGDQPFYMSMLVELARCASLATGQNYVVVPALPAKSFETVSIWGLFARLEDRQMD